MVNLLQLLTSDSVDDAQTPDVVIHSDQETVFMEVSGTVLQDVNRDLQALMQGCSQGRCKFCTRAKWFKACIEATILKLGFEFKVSLSGRTDKH
ncbi:hypothetical protein DPMN_053965 [Dreissena polymorpha]|uniref:Uncharacterized protein n=1 Tax=Dreissena polymorpha TaxID=45954 RepID=A0A9D4HR75_DREPO|nr:hypothetical protein DPMN_053965 [Dreissena polymorpha]